MDEMEKLIQQINDSLKPISDNIENNLKRLEKFTGEPNNYSYKPLNIEEIQSKS